MILPYSPIAFGARGPADLERWLKHAQLHGREVLPITDETTDLGMPCIRVPVEGLCWGNHQLHICDWLRAQSARIHGGPVLACDTDWIPLKEVLWEAYVDKNNCGLTLDSGLRKHTIMDCGYEQNTGVMLLYPNFGHLYDSVWHKEDFRKYAAKFPWAGQIASTIVWRWLRGYSFIENLNLSWWRLRDSRTPAKVLDTAAAVHFHGRGKDHIERYMQLYKDTYGK